MLQVLVPVNASEAPDGKACNECFLFDLLRQKRGVIPFLTQLMAREDIVKVLHGLNSGTAAALAQMGISFRNVFDTQARALVLMFQGHCLLSSASYWCVHVKLTTTKSNLFL